jgi:hypothetical protein
MVDHEFGSFHADLENRVQAALNKASVFSIGSFGWLNENDPDPDFIGHAMWQVDAPPVDRFIIDDSQNQKIPSELEKEIYITGEDFWGLMEASRLSIGLALVWKDEAQRNPVNQSSFLWLHYTDAFLKLAIASDRLRDLLIVACTGGPAKIYKKQKPKPKYVHPFERADQLVTQRGIETAKLIESIRALPALSNRLYEYIEVRNEIVHEIATRMGQFVAERLSNPRQSRKRLDGDRAKSQREVLEEIDRGIGQLRDWYDLLITTSNHVFQVEYWTRRSAHL